MTTPATSNENRLLGDLGPKVIVGVAMPGLVLIIAAIFIGLLSGMETSRFLRAYLVAYVFVVSLALGGLWFVMLQYLTKAGWSVVVRRLAEGLAGNLRWLWIGFIPLIIWKGDLYHWTHPGDDALLLHKEPFLNPTFWTIRAIFYFVVWGVLAQLFVSWSRAQDNDGNPTITQRLQKIAAPGMILYAVTQTFAIIDWVMAIEPHWFSTMFGVYYFAASTCGIFATLILLAFALQRTGRVTESITVEHYHDLGKLLFGFGVVFWAYIGYSQYMLIWYANIQEETIWFLIRQMGGWKYLSIFLLVGHFVLPFFLLISRIPKRHPPVLAALAAWMLFMHFIDMYWLAMPEYPAEMVASVSTYQELVTVFALPENAHWDLHWSIVDFMLVFGLTGIFLGMTAWGMRSSPLVPQGDPRLAESLAFENF